MNKNVLKAILKALSTAAGPLGAPGEFLLNLDKDMEDDRRHSEIIEKLSEMINKFTAGQEITRKQIEDIIVFKSGLVNIRGQIVSGILASLEIIDQHKYLLSDEISLRTSLPTFLASQRQVANKYGFVTQKRLADDLLELYGNDVELFQTHVRMTGFPMENVPWNKEGIIVIDKFLARCKSLENAHLAEIFALLAAKNPRSEVLRVTASILEELSKITDSPSREL